MPLTQTSTTVKVISPTLHLYHYVLRNGVNERPEALRERRKLFNDNLQKIASHLTTSTGKSGSDVVKLIPIEQDLARSGTVLDFANVPPECRKFDNDRLYFETGIIHSRLAVRRINDTYFLRLIRYVPSAKGEQSLDLFGNLGEHLSSLQIELGQTAILAGIIDTQSYSKSTDYIAAECLNPTFRTSSCSIKIIQRAIATEALS